MTPRPNLAAPTPNLLTHNHDCGIQLGTVKRDFGQMIARSQQRIELVIRYQWLG
jgi:hypothetical protein